MDIVIDLTSIQNFLNLSPDLMMWRIFFLFGWIPLAITFLWGAKELWLFYIRVKWGGTQKFILLAIDIPRGNEQSPKAVENLFTYFGGAHNTLNLIENYWEGKYQLTFSFEVVSIEGYTQFLINTPVQFKNLVESAVYSQYPDAEITEVDDYTAAAPDRFPDDEYDIWGCEFIQEKNSSYPIKMYEEFEHQMGETESYFRDPMASLMDLYSSLGKGEQIWYQILARPTGFDWPEEGEKEISKIIGEKNGSSFFNDIIDRMVGWLGTLSEVIYSIWGDIEEKEKSEDDNRFLMMNLKPKQKKQIESIQTKISKLGFEYKSRFIYLAKKEVFNKPKGVGGFIGFIKQFMDLDLNGLKPDLKITATKAEYLFANYRGNIKKNNLMQAYKGRSTTIGRNMGLMNIEELATLWHFPVEAVVKAPLIQKAPGRKAEAPMELPVGEEIVSEEILEPIFMEEEKDNKKNNIPTEKTKTKVKAEPPANLPV